MRQRVQAAFNRWCGQRELPVSAWYYQCMKTYINVRIPERAYKALRKRADKERRTLVSMIEILAGV